MSLLKLIYIFLCEMGRARAAAHLAYCGDYAGARRIMKIELK
jgi:hypothetical protein